MKLRKCPICGIRKPKSNFTVVPENRNPVNKSYAKADSCHGCQRLQGKGSFGGYIGRDRILRSLGFKSYQEYLNSSLWQTIRGRVFRLRGRLCICGNAATQVHHNVYDRRILSGQSLRGLQPICEDCHKQIEFYNGRKVGVNEASRRFSAASITP